MAAFNISEIIDLIPTHKLTTGSGCDGQTEFNAIRSLESSLNHPINFPTLDQAILQEDSVCIAIESGIPSEEKIASQAAKAIHSLGVDQSSITILLPEGASKKRVEAIQSALASLSCDRCSVKVHCASDLETIGYLGPSESGEPITLNARLVHAGFVLPIARAKPFGWKSKIDFLYPYFSDLESQKRFFKLNHHSRIRLNQEVHRWLGNCFLISIATKVVLNADGKQQVFGTTVSGENDAVVNAIQDHFQEVDSANARVDNKKPHDLVIANLNPHLCVSHEEVRESLQDLKELCTSRGTVVLIWNDDNQVPALVGEDADLEELSNQFEDDKTVYLQTDQPQLKKLGLSSIDNRDEMERLIENHESVLLLPDFINDFAFHRQEDWNDPSRSDRSKGASV